MRRSERAPTETAPRRIAAVVVHHGEEALTLAALRSLKESRGAELFAVIVDHGPGPGELLAAEAEETAGLYLRPPANLGFAGGLNQGIQALLARGGADLYLLLNGDVVLDPDCAATLARRFAEQPSLGLLGPAVLYRDRPGLVWNAGSEIVWPAGRPRSLFHDTPPEDLPQEPYPVGFVCGCAAMASRALLERLGPLPERYFLYFEDAELSFAARAAGFKVEVEPRARALHAPGSSVAALEGLSGYCRSRNRIHFSRRWAPPGPLPRLARLGFLLSRWSRGGAERRGALAGWRGSFGPPPGDLLPASRD
jgi:GT2 family glycosyltransferase